MIRLMQLSRFMHFYWFFIDFLIVFEVVAVCRLFDFFFCAWTFLFLFRWIVAIILCACTYVSLSFFFLLSTQLRTELTATITIITRQNSTDLSRLGPIYKCTLYSVVCLLLPHYNAQLMQTHESEKKESMLTMRRKKRRMKETCGHRHQLSGMCACNYTFNSIAN